MDEIVQASLNKMKINKFFSTKIKTFLIIALLSTLYFSVVPTPASATLFDDFISEMNKTLLGGVDSVKDLIAPVGDKNSKKELTLESDIKLAEGGDVNKNNQIDSGDIVKFSFVLTNTTDESYAYATLKTNINKKQLNFIHSLRGATGLSNNKESIEFRNVRIGLNEQRLITFNARVNYSEEDKVISLEPELISSDNKTIGKLPKKEVQANKLSKEEISKRLEHRKATLIKKEEKL